MQLLVEIKCGFIMCGGIPPYVANFVSSCSKLSRFAPCKDRVGYINLALLLSYNKFASLVRAYLYQKSKKYFTLDSPFKEQPKSFVCRDKLICKQ